MSKLRIGVLGNAGIANKRFLPALAKCSLFEFSGIAVENHNENYGEQLARATETARKYGGKVYESYDALLNSSDIDCVYIPLPPALHYKWAKKALDFDKHVYLEKPFTTSMADTKSLISLAESKNLAVFENYAFIYHKEISAIKKLINEKKFGNLQLIRASFGFPYRGNTDFRYYKDMGGGALFDCGGYTIKVATEFMGPDISVKLSKLYTQSRHDVDMNGNIILEDKNGLTAQLAFGMDSSYKCDLELWGSTGYVKVDRFFTPPAEYETKITFSDSKSSSEIVVGSDDQFLHALEHFHYLVDDFFNRKIEYTRIAQQARLIEEVQKYSANM